MCKVKLGIGIACIVGDRDLQTLTLTGQVSKKKLNFCMGLNQPAQPFVVLVFGEVREHEDTKVVKKKTRCLEAMLTWQFFAVLVGW